MLFRTLCLRGRGTVFNILVKSTSSRSSGSLSLAFSRVTVTVDIKDNIGVNKCKFHTTQRLDIPPGLAILFRPITRIGALLFGRYLKKWWARKTPEEKEAYKKWFSAKRQKIYGALGVLLASLLLFYVTHIEINPLTGRSRFIALTKEQEKHLAKLIFSMNLQLHQDSIIRTDHPAYIRLTRIVDRIIKANKDMPSVADKHWTLTVIDSDSKNAFVLPGGNIFVFLGALKTADNDDQLAVVLSHEIAHLLLEHPIEQMSRNLLWDIFLVIPIVVIWAIYPDLLAILLQGVGSKIVHVLAALPYSRQLELEADDVGMELAAKACFDVREAVVFWKMMTLLTEADIEPSDIPWLSTHPNHKDRAEFLSTKMDEAIALRMKSGCSRLSPYDPIAAFDTRTPRQQAAYLKAKGFL